MRIGHARELGAHGSASVASMAMPALPRAAGTVEHVEAAALPATMAGSRPRIGLAASCARESSSRAPRSNSSMPRSTASVAVLGLDRARIGGLTKISLPASSRAQTGAGSASIRARRAAASSICFWWRRGNSASSRLTPLTSLSRRIARPPITWPSASTCDRRASSGSSRSHATRAQRIDRTFHRLRLLRLEPGAEREHALRRLGGGDQRGVADDLGLVARLPRRR